jgi:hypothetical protein
VIALHFYFGNPSISPQVSQFNFISCLCMPETASNSIMTTSTRNLKQKQAVVVVDPLRDAGILGQVFALLPGTYLFLGAVCRE